jgi:hypothetical protein
MRRVLFITAMIGGVVSTGIVPAKALPNLMPGIATKVQVGPVQDVGWRRRYRRYGYTVPYAYYPPGYGYYYPPPAYYAPAYPAYPYHAPYRYYRPYYAPYY